MKTIKKAQSGVKQKPKPITGPTFVNLRMARDKSGTGLPATRQDSIDYKKGWVRGLKGDKPSAMEKKYQGENEYEKMGRWEGQNKGKKNAVKKGKTGLTVKKAQRGARVNKKTGMDAVKALGKHISTFGGATERDNPKQKDINIVKKLKETGNKVKNKLGLKSGGSVKKCKYGCK